MYLLISLDIQTVTTNLELEKNFSVRMCWRRSWGNDIVWNTRNNYVQHYFQHDSV